MTDKTEFINRIIEQWQAGINREENFRRLFERYYRPVYRFFEKRGFSVDDCHDLTQETFIRVYKGVETFRREARFETWLFQIAAHTFQKALRYQSARQRAGQHVSWEGTAEREQVGLNEGEPSMFSSKRSPIDEVLEKERAELLRRAVEQLPEQMRKCVMLRVDQELSYQEIAVVLRLSVETVKAHLHQARQRLKVKLAEYFAEPEF